MAAVVKNVRDRSPPPAGCGSGCGPCGVRPINNIVDITNYVMLEYGQPMHAFDLQICERRAHIIVRNAQARREHRHPGRRGPHACTAEMLVIADEKGPIAVAGVMGGEFSGMYDDTTTIVFESAMLQRPLRAHHGQKAGHAHRGSAAAMKRGWTPTAAAAALDRALELVQLLDAGDVVDGVVDVWAHTSAKNAASPCAWMRSTACWARSSDNSADGRYPAAAGLRDGRRR